MENLAMLRKMLEGKVASIKNTPEGSPMAKLKIDIINLQKAIEAENENHQEGDRS